MQPDHSPHSPSPWASGGEVGNTGSEVKPGKKGGAEESFLKLWLRYFCNPTLLSLVINFPQFMSVLPMTITDLSLSIS